MESTLWTELTFHCLLLHFSQHDQFAFNSTQLPTWPKILPRHQVVVSPHRLFFCLGTWSDIGDMSVRCLCKILSLIGLLPSLCHTPFCLFLNCFTFSNIFMISVHVAFFFQEQNKHLFHIALYNNKSLVGPFPKRLKHQIDYRETTADISVMLDSW